MSVIRPESVRVIGQSGTAPRMSDAAAAAVAEDAEYRLRLVIQEARKFMHHSKRTTMCAQDINHSLHTLKAEGVYGFCSDEPMVVEEIADGLFEVKDPDVDLEDVAAAALPRVPPQPSLSVHWLAVEGVQPRVPQNPPRQPSWDLFATGGTGAGGGSGTAASNTGHQLLRGGATKRARDSISADSAAIVYPGIVVQHHGQRVRVKVKPQVTHQLSAEMQVYFGKVVEAIRLHDASAEAVIGTLRTHAGLHQLVPYFCHFIPREVDGNLRNLPVLTCLMRVVEALLINKHLRSQLESYMHQLMPAVLSCVVGKYLCADPVKDDHWALRHLAAHLVATICRCYGELYPTLRGRVAKTLFGAFADVKKPLTTQYGAVVGIVALGTHVFESLLLWQIPAFLDRLAVHLTPAEQPRAPKANRRLAQRRLQAHRCLGATTAAVAHFLKYGHDDPRQRASPGSKKRGLGIAAAFQDGEHRSAVAAGAVAAAKAQRRRLQASIPRPGGRRATTRCRFMTAEARSVSATIGAESVKAGLAVLERLTDASLPYTLTPLTSLVGTSLL